MYNTIGQRVKSRYFSSKEFIGVIKSKVCVNNGRGPAYAYHIELESPIETSFGPVLSICFIDRDQLSFNNVLEVL